MAHGEAVHRPLERLGDGRTIAALDPRSRILGAALWAVVVVGLESLAVLAAAVATALVVARLAALPAKATARKVLTMDGFIVALLVLLPFTTPGVPIAAIGPFEASAEGLRLALTIALKANAVVLMLLALVGTLEPATLGHALNRLAVPAGLVHLLLFTVRYIAVLNEEAHRLRVAMRVRGFRPRTDRHTLKTYGYLVGMLLVRAAERAERVLDAMKCRGFEGRLTLLTTSCFTRADLVAAGLAAVGLGLLVAAEIRLVAPA